MAHPLSSELHRARLLNRKKHIDSVYAKLDTLCKELSDMDIQSFFAVQDMIDAELDGDIAATEDYQHVEE